MPKLSDFLGGSSTVLSIPLGATATVMNGSKQFQAVGSILRRSEYPDLAAAYPPRTLSGTTIRSFGAAPNQFGVPQAAARLGSIHAFIFNGKIATTTDFIKWKLTTLPESKTYTAIAAGGGRLVAVGPNCSAYSTDGETWVEGGATGSPPWPRLVYFNGKFVSVFGTASIASTNGVSWNQGTLPNPSSNAIAAGATRLVALSGNSSFLPMYSTDGVSWVNGNALPSGFVSANLTFGAGKMVLIGENLGQVAYSADDGVTWTAANLPSPSSWGSAGRITFNAAAGLFIAIHPPTGVVATSPDAAAWTDRGAILPATNQPNIFGYDQLTFVGAIVGSNNIATLYKSSDGLSFSRVHEAGGQWRGSAYGVEKFVAISGFVSDLVTYMPLDSAAVIAAQLPYKADWTGCAFGNGKFVAIASETSRAATSGDADVWTAMTMPVSAPWSAVAYGTKFVAIAGRNIASNVAAFSATGLTGSWTLATLPSSKTWCALAHGGGRYVAISGGRNAQSNAAAFSTDGGATWTASTLPATANWAAITYGNGAFVAVSLSGNHVAVSEDGGETWTLHALPDGVECEVITFNGSYFMAAANDSAAVYLSINGKSWRAIAVSQPDIWATAMYAEGKTILLSKRYQAHEIYAEEKSTAQFIYITGTVGQLVRVF